MRHLREVFTDEEFKTLTRIKGDSTWHDFIMTLAAKADIGNQVGSAPLREDYYDYAEFYEAYVEWLNELKIQLEIQPSEEIENGE